jgi:hypothetical protein
MTQKYFLFWLVMGWFMAVRHCHIDGATTGLHFRPASVTSMLTPKPQVYAQIPDFLTVDLRIASPVLIARQLS